MEELINYLAQAEDGLVKATRLADNNEDIAIPLTEESRLNESIDDYAANLRATIINLKKRETKKAIKEIISGLQKLNKLTNEDDFALELIEHCYPKSLKEDSLLQMYFSFHRYLDNIKDY